jgi:hypothetical protein
MERRCEFSRCVGGNIDDAWHGIGPDGQKGKSPFSFLSFLFSFYYVFLSLSLFFIIIFKIHQNLFFSSERFLSISKPPT